MRSVMRGLAGAAAIAAALGAPLAAQAQAYPAKPIRLVTEFVAGSGGDALLRVIMTPMSQNVGQPIVLDSRPGAGGLLAAELVARADPDGYTWLAGAPNVHTVRQWLTRTSPFDSLKELTPITPVAEVYLGIVMNPSVPVRNMKELIDYARKNPGKLSYASSGIGSTFHLDAELIQMLTGIKLVQVPYKSLSQAMSDIVTGQIPMGFALTGQANGNVKAGKLTPIAIVGDHRYPEWPDVGLISEAVPGFAAPAGWTALFGPARLPPALTQRIYKEVLQVLANNDVRSKLASIGVETRSMPPEQFASHIREQRELIGKIVKTAGIQPID